MTRKTVGVERDRQTDTNRHRDEEENLRSRETDR